MENKFVSSPSSSAPTLYYVACDGLILNLSEPFDTVEKARSFVDSCKERDRLSLMLHKRLLRKIMKKKVSPDLHDYSILVEVSLS